MRVEAIKLLAFLRNKGIKIYEEEAAELETLYKLVIKKQVTYLNFDAEDMSVGTDQKLFILGFDWEQRIKSV